MEQNKTAGQTAIKVQEKPREDSARSTRYDAATMERIRKAHEAMGVVTVMVVF